MNAFPFGYEKGFNPSTRVRQSFRVHMMSTIQVNICLIESVEPPWRWFGVVAEKEDLHANNWI